MKSVNQEMQWFGVEACAGRVKYDDPRMYHFRSWEPKTPFAPRFDCPMWLDQVEPEKCKKILEQWEEEKRRGQHITSLTSKQKITSYLRLV